MGRPTKYDWDTILNGEVWRLTQGEDFQVPPDQFRRAVIGKARAWGIKVQTTVDRRSVIVQAYDPRGEE